MTRGTLAYVEYDFDKNCFTLKTSEEFNGDMGVDMVNGETTIERLSNAKTPVDFEKVVWDTICDFEYDDDYEEDDLSNMMETLHLSEGVGATAENPFEITEGVLERIFNYSDYEYIASYKADFFVKDRSGKVVKIAVGTPCVFCFGEYIGVIASDGSFVDESDNPEKN